MRTARNLGAGDPVQERRRIGSNRGDWRKLLQRQYIAMLQIGMARDTDSQSVDFDP